MCYIFTGWCEAKYVLEKLMHMHGNGFIYMHKSILIKNEMKYFKDK